MNNSIIKIEIDGIEFNAKKGSKIIEVADEVGIYIPRFCYHKNLSIAANCRMCLVEIEKAPKLFPACATPITDGMKIHTNTEKVIDAQRAVMEFLLINHPLDCPICDQGGECELQDLTVGYGCASSRFIEKKRSFKDYDLGALISTDVTRCILCSRCVRFCSEIAGTDELGIIGRGSNSRIFTFLKEHLTSEISGNIIDLCPVGALTAKPSKFKFRPWELVQNSFISFHDCMGSNLYAHTFNDKVIRIVPKRNESINETWISDRDRFSYEGLYSEDRIHNPIIKKNNQWVDVTWKEALDCIYKNITDITDTFDASEISTLASPNSTVEEFYILQKLMRALGSNNIDHRLNQLDFTNQDKFPSFPGIDIDIENIDKSDTVLIIGSNITKEQPIIGIKLRKIINNGGKVFIINPINFNLSINMSEQFIINPKDFIEKICNLINAYPKTEKQPINVNLSHIKDDNEWCKNIISSFIDGKKKLILLGSYITNNPDYSKILSVAQILSDITKSNFGVLTDGANAAGAWLTGFIPHRLPHNVKNKELGLDTLKALSKKLKAYVLFGTEMEYDSMHGKLYIDALKNAMFILAFSSFKNKNLLNYANVILPITTGYEKSGSFINISGTLQSFNAIVPSKNETKHGWEAICSIANKFELSGFVYKNEKDILNEFKTLNKEFNKPIWETMSIENLVSSIKDDIIIIPEICYFKIDPLIRRAKSLQESVNYKQTDTLKCNSNTYKKIKDLKIIDLENTFDVIIENNISDNCVSMHNNCNLYEKVLPYSALSNITNKY
ncbi:MAG TPA: NADH-quinone oxidoreductase subunit NuoG [Candidatus Azoamicus sp. MARI]